MPVAGESNNRRGQGSISYGTLIGNKVKDLYNRVKENVLGTTLDEETEAAVERMRAQADINDEYLGKSYKTMVDGLRAAGLNVDLAVGGGVAGSAANASGTDGVPSIGSKHGQVPALLSSLAQQELVGSQINLNQSAAEKNQAETAESESKTRFNDATLSLYVDKMSADLDWTKEQTRVAHETIDLIQMQVQKLQNDIDMIHSEMRLYDQKYFTEKYNTQFIRNKARTEGFQGSLLEKQVLAFDETSKAQLELLVSGKILNKAHAAEIWQNVSFLRRSFNDRLLNTSTEWQMRNAFTKFYQAQRNYTNALVSYLPYQMSDAILNAHIIYEHDKDGNIKYDANGMPVVNLSFADWKRGMTFVDDVLGSIYTLSQSLMNVFVGFGFAKGGGMGKNVGVGVGNKGSIDTSLKPFGISKARMDALNELNKCTPGSPEYIRAYRKYMNVD